MYSKILQKLARTAKHQLAVTRDHPVDMITIIKIWFEPSTLPLSIYPAPDSNFKVSAVLLDIVSETDLASLNITQLVHVLARYIYPRLRSILGLREGVFHDSRFYDCDCHLLTGSSRVIMHEEAVCPSGTSGMLPSSHTGLKDLCFSQA
jgi:hypothetical protein